MIKLTSLFSFASVRESKRISRNSAEGLCQALASEMFPEFREWFDAHPELRPFNGEYPNITKSKLTTIPMHYRHPTKLRPYGFTAELPVDVRKAHPAIKLSCQGVMWSPSGNYLNKITFNGQTQAPSPHENWTF